LTKLELMMDGSQGSNEKMMIYLRELEELAEDILSDRQEVVDLDRKRHANREALSALDKQAKQSWKAEQTKTWISLNNCFIQLPNATATKMLKKDQVRLDVEINKLRSDLKVKVNSLHEKEGRPELKGFGLKALDSQELRAIKQVQRPKPT